MKRKTIIFCLIVISAIFSGIKLKNYLLGNSILGYTDISSKRLKLLPQKRDIKKNFKVNDGLLYTLGNIQFSVARKDTAITFKFRNVYKSFKFRDNSHLLVFKDSVQFDFFKLLTSIKFTDNNVIDNFAKQRKLLSQFDLLLYAYNKTPDDISFFNLYRENTVIQYTFLKIKDVRLGNGSDRGFYFFLLKHIKGFQYGSPASTDKTFISFFTDKNDNYTIFSSGLKQRDLDYILASIDASL